MCQVDWAWVLQIVSLVTILSFGVKVRSQNEWIFRYVRRGGVPMITIALKMGTVGGFRLIWRNLDIYDVLASSSSRLIDI